MTGSAPAAHIRLILAVLALAVLPGCASLSADKNLSRINEETTSFTEGQLGLARSNDERASRLQAAEILLATPLGQREAVQLTLLNSASLQALLAQGWSASADAAQIGRLSNPRFSVERLVAGGEIEIGRALTFGLLDVLTLPARQGIADRRLEQAQLRLSSDVIDQVTSVRQAWVRAVAAEQTLAYARQVYDTAEASAELARRMQAAGNFNRLSRAREQAFYADAGTRLAAQRHEVTATREELVRLLGLDEAQAESLKLPERLPVIPKEPLSPQALGTQATKGRLDIRLAQVGLEAAAKAQGLTLVTSFTDIELTGRRNSKSDRAAGTESDPTGFEVAVRLPIFDWGGLQRDAMDARTLAAASQLEATVRVASSNLRESYSGYRTTYDIARHYHEEIVPLRKIISDENLLRYNGMLIGVFELLADSRDQINAVIAAISAEQQFWLADAALQASLIGRPTSTMPSVMYSTPGGG